MITKRSDRASLELSVKQCEENGSKYRIYQEKLGMEVLMFENVDELKTLPDPRDDEVIPTTGEFLCCAKTPLKNCKNSS